MSLISEARENGPKLAEMVIALYEKVLKDADHELYRDAEDFDPGDGGNFDDTYELGFTDGEISYAQDIWKEMEGE